MELSESDMQRMAAAMQGRAHDERAPQAESLSAAVANAVRDVLPGILREVLRDLSDPRAPLDHKAAAKRLNVSERKLDGLAAAGYLKPIYLGRKRLYPADQLDGLLRRAERERID